VKPDDETNLAKLDTEQVRPDLAHLDELSTADLVSLMVRDVHKVPEALALAEDQLSEAVGAIVERMRRGGRLLYVGAGTAGRLGMLDAAEAGPTFNVDEGQVRGILAGGLNAFGVPVENAEDDREGGALAMVDHGVSELDCVVGISASGRTPYVLGAIDEATRRGALRVGVSCNAHTPLSEAVTHPIEVVVGPEVIAGSTRMNAGTAQKFVLNVLSTATMVELGKTYGNLMVDLRPTNEKLRDRAVRIVALITSRSPDEVRPVLEASSWRTKVACVMIVGELDADRAARELDAHDGRLRPALDALARTPETPSRAWTRLGVGAALVNGELVPGDVAIHDGEIVAVGLHGTGTGVAIAGFVDAQVNGYAGVDLLSATVEQMLDMGDALQRDGVIAYQPTLITSNTEDLLATMSRLREARAQRRGARILDCHLEGPFLSPTRSGTHPAAHLRAPDLRLLDTLLENGDVAMITVAPELPGALEVIGAAAQHGLVVSLGHSAASAGEAHRGFDAGASTVTHLFNAMEPLSARSPGLAGVALTRPDVTVQLLGDGVHVADEILLIAFRAAHGRCVLVTDAIAAAASTAETVKLGDVTVHVRNGVARRDDGTIAGSIGRLRDILVRVHAIGVSRDDVLHAVTTRPSNLLRHEGLADVRVGSRATLLVLDQRLRIVRRLVDGNDAAVE
jgi:N-acetylmuramic acid 6-phosphate etherase/N-acetylglucosamine-6-phosphate deacetylase